MDVKDWLNSPPGRDFYVRKQTQYRKINVSIIGESSQPDCHFFLVYNHISVAET